MITKENNEITTMQMRETNSTVQALQNAINTKQDTIIIEMRGHETSTNFTRDDIAICIDDSYSPSSRC